MPLIIVLFIGILAFGVFDLMFDRSLPVAALQHSVQQNLNSPIENANLPSIPVAAASETAHCERHDTACQLVALYRFALTTISPEVSRSPWLHTATSRAHFFYAERRCGRHCHFVSSLLDQRHIRNYVVTLPRAAMSWPATFHHFPFHFFLMQSARPWISEVSVTP